MLKQFEDNPDFVDKVNIRMNVQPDEGVFQIDFNVDFDDMDDLDYFFKNTDKIKGMLGDGEDDDLGMLGGGMGMGDPLESIMGGNANMRPFDLKKRTLIRRDDATEAERSEIENMGMEEMQMMEMMFGEATYKLIYHLPGKVKAMTNKDATMSADKKTVQLEGAMMDYIKGDFKVDNIIKFGKK